MTKTFTQTQGILHPDGHRSGLPGLLMASFLLAVSAGAQADAFGSSGGQNAVLLERLSTLEKELKDLKEKGAGVPSAAASVSAPAGKTGKAGKANRPKLVLPPPPGLDELPSGGASERERLLVEKELTYEVLGYVNNMVLVRDGDRQLLLAKKELKSFEKRSRQRVVKKLKVEAVSQSDSRIEFPELQPTGTAPTPGAVTPPPPPAPSTFSQAGQVVNQARALEANHGQIPPAAPTAPAHNPTPALSTAPVAAPTVATPTPAPAAAQAKAPATANSAAPVKK